MPSFNVAEAKRTPQIVIRDGKGDVVTVVTPRDLQVGFEGSPGALILKGALDINAFVLQISNPADAANVRVSNDKIAYFILNDSGVGVTVKLPTPPANPGQTHIIKDYRGTASNATPITITTDDGSTIDGQTAQNIVIAYGAIMFVWTGQGWVSLALGASGAGGGAPNNSRYVVWGTEIGLSNSRVLSVTSGHLTLDTTAPNANLGLANTGTPGTYTFPSEITVDSQGRVTSITSTTGSGGNADPGAQYIVMALTASLTNERVATQGLGIRITDGGANGPATWAINNSVVATISGSTFTGATLHTAGLSGSLTRLTDGRSYIVGGTGITVTSASNGQVTITGLAASSSIDAPINATYLVLTADGTLTAERVFAPINGIKFTDGGAGGTYNIFIDDRIVATISGSTFSGVTNHTAGLSGSLTRLTNGQSYLVAGSNIIITSASNGQITISSTASGSGGGAGTGDNGAAYVVMALTASLPNERVLAAGTGIAITDGGPGGSVTIGLTGASSQSADIYDGFTTQSLNWGNSTTWTDFTNIASGFQDRIRNGISRSASTWFVSKDGYYAWHSDFNYAMSTGYLAFRLSGSAGSIIQQTSYDNASDAASNARLDGIISLTSGNSFRLQYVRNTGTAGTWNVSNPIDGENMVTGRVTVFRIADPITVGSGSIGGSGGGADVSASYVVLGTTSSLPNERVLTAGTGISIVDNGPNGTVVISATGGGTGTGSCQVAYHDLTYNPVGLWQLSGNLNDSGSIPTNLTVGAGTARYTVMAPGLLGAMFDGSTFFVNTASLPTSLVLTGAMTVEMLAIVNASNTTQTPFMIGGLTGDVNGRENYLFQFAIGPGGYPTYVAEFGAGANISFTFNASSVPFYTLCHLAMSRDASNVLRFYVNGNLLETSLAQTQANTGSAAPSSARILLGSETAGSFSTLGTQPLARTSLASVKLVARQLTDAEIYAEYQRTIGAACGSSTSNSGGGSGQAYVTGTWRDAVNAFITTGSVSIDSQNRTAAQIGSDVFFFVSGNTGLSGTAAGRIAAFGGDVKITGTLSVGTGSLYIDSNEVRWDTNVKIFQSGSDLRLSDKNNPSGFSLSQLAQSGSTTGGNFTVGFAQSNYTFVTNSNEINVSQGNVFVGIPGLTGTITTTGSPVMISVNANYFVVSGSPQSTAIFALARNGANIGHSVWGNMVAGPQVVGYNNNASFWFVDFPPAGTYSYSLIACAPTGSGKLSAAGLGPTTLTAFEMKGANVVTASTMQQQAVPGGPLTGLSATILPVRGPVLALASLNYSNDLAGNWAWNNIRRDSTDLGSTFGIGLTVGLTAGEMQNMSVAVLDTPSIGASHTYTVRATNGLGTGVIGRNGQLQTLIVWEVPDVNFKYTSTTNNVALGASYTDVAVASPSLSIVSRGRPIWLLGCTQINTTNVTGRSAWSFLKNGTSVVSASKGLQILDGEGKNDWNKQVTFSWLDTVVTGVSTYQLAGYNISGSNGSAQGPTLTTFFVYELDAGTEIAAGPWIDGGTKIKTTSSVAIDSDGRYADAVGSDVFFFVSGSQNKKSVFGGDVVISGSLRISGSRPVPRLSIPILAGVNSTNAATSGSKQSIGAIYFDPSTINLFNGTRTYYYRAILDTSETVVSAAVDLYDVNSICAATPGIVTGSIMSSSNLTMTQIQSDLTSIFQNVVNPGILEARLWKTVSGSLTSSVACRNARLDIEFS